MFNDLYWISALTYAVILAVIFLNDIWSKKNPGEAEKAFRITTLAMVFFCLQDMVWGLCENSRISNDGVFVVSSSVFHATTVIMSFFWLYFVLHYLRGKINTKKTFLIFDGCVVLFEIVLVIINFYNPILFEIVDGRYVPGPLRPLTFINQYMVFICIGIVALIYYIKKRDEREDDSNERYRIIFMATLAPILLGVFQLLYPDAPFYSLGYFLACFLTYILVVAKDRSDNEMNDVFRSIANTFYSMHLFDLETNTADNYIESDILSGLIGDEKNGQEMINKVIRGTVTDEYLDTMLEFVDFSTLSERLKDKKQISFEFVGKNFGWTRMNIFSVESEGDIQKRVMVTTKIIDAEKKSQIDLLFKSNNDELTGLLNRRAFENDLKDIENNGAKDNFVLIYMDVNGLKQTNDTLGHVIGDELLKAASSCMKKCFGAYGKVYRTGGDEFNAIIYATKHQLKIIKQDFEDTVMSWEGQNIKELAVSCGYVTKREDRNRTVQEMAIIAEDRMYEAKSDYYKVKGVDRRGQKDAHTALCSLYTKILKINISSDTYQIINMNDSERTIEKGFSPKISEWLTNFGKTGQVHPDDLQSYLEQTDLDYLKMYFSRGKTSIHIFYRRKYGDVYKETMMEMIPANDYSNNDQNLYLYVKNIDR